MSTVRPISAMPGPRGQLFLGVLKDFRKEAPWLVCERYTREFGPLAHFKLLGRHAVAVGAPDLIEQVVSEKTDAFYKKRPVAAVKPFHTEDLFVSPGGDDWRRKRVSHAMLTPLSRETMAVTGERCAAHTAAFIGQLPESFDAKEAIFRLGFELLSIVIFGRALGADGLTGFQWMTRTAHRRMHREATSMLRLGGFSQAERRSEAEWLAVLGQAYESCTESLCMAAELKARGMEKGAASRYIAGTFMGGGVSIPATLLNAMFHLAQAPGIAGETRRRLRADTPPYDALPTYLPLEAPLRESLRVFAPVPLYLRTTSRKTELGGYTLPAGTGLMLSVWTLQRDPTHWKDPEQFLPSRWDAETLAKNPVGSGYFAPFGWGPRACVGGEFALAIVRAALATLISDGTVTVGQGQEYVPQLFMGVRVPKSLQGRRTSR